MRRRSGQLKTELGTGHLAAGYHSQLKTWTKANDESLHESATTIEQLTHHAFPALHEDHVLKGPASHLVMVLEIEA
jgi:hypothetical protein